MTVGINSVQVSPVNNGRQTITIPVDKKGAYIQCNTTAEKVDAYMSAQNRIKEKAGNRGVLFALLSTIAGLGVGHFACKGDLVGKLVIGGGSGLLAGFIGALCFADAGDKKIQKLNEDFVAQNS